MNLFPEILIIYLKMELQGMPYIYKNTQNFVINLSLNKPVNIWLRVRWFMLTILNKNGT